jgi:hypothetical protein
MAAIFQWFTNSIKDLMNHYEEDIYGKLQDFFKKHEIYNICLILFIFSMIYFLPLLLFSKEDPSLYCSAAYTSKETKRWSRFVSPSELIEYFPTNHKLRSLFNLLGNRIKFPSSQTPLAIVLAGRNVTKEELKFKEISNNHFWMENITIHADSEITEAGLFNEINKKLEKHDGKAFVFIDEVDKLSGRTPLVLQSLSDVDASKYKDPVYVLTVIDDEFDKQLNEKECTEMITKKLEKAWSSSLHSDQLQPILSRITSITVCLS